MGPRFQVAIALLHIIEDHFNTSQPVLPVQQSTTLLGLSNIISAFWIFYFEGHTIWFSHFNNLFTRLDGQWASVVCVDPETPPVENHWPGLLVLLFTVLLSLLSHSSLRMQADASVVLLLTSLSMQILTSIFKILSHPVKCHCMIITMLIKTHLFLPIDTLH